MADGGAESNTGKGHTGCFFERSCEGIQPAYAENKLSSERKGDSTLRESSTREEVNENISESPVIESWIFRGNEVCLVKIARGKIYTLPFALATKPEMKYSEGFPCIKHENVWYKFEVFFPDSLRLQNMQTHKYIKMYEDSDHVHGTGERTEKTIKSRHRSANECGESLETQTIAETSSLMMEGIRNSSVDTAHKAGGEIVKKTDKKADKRPESNRGETDQRDNEEKPINEKEDKSKIGASISSKGSIVRRFQEETGLTLDINFSQTQFGDIVQRFKKEFSVGETNKISGGHTDKTDEKEKNKSQTSKEEVNQSETDTSVEDFCEIEGREKDKKLSGNKDGDSNKIFEGKPVNTCNGNASQISEIESNPEHTHLLVYRASENTENKPEHTHPLVDSASENTNKPEHAHPLVDSASENTENKPEHTHPLVDSASENTENKPEHTHPLVDHASENTENKPEHTHPLVDHASENTSKPEHAHPLVDRASENTEHEPEHTHPLVDSASDNTNKPEHRHPLDPDQKLANNSDGKIRRCLNVGDTFEKNGAHTARNEKSQTPIRATHELKNADKNLVNGVEGKKMPKENFSQKTSDQTDEKDIDEQLEEKDPGGKINREVSVKTGNAFEREASEVHSDVTEKRIAVSTNTEHEDSIPRALKSLSNLNAGPKLERTHKPCQEHAPYVDVTGSLKGKLHEESSSQTVAETTDEISQQETDHTQKGLGETSEVSLGQIEHTPDVNITGSLKGKLQEGISSQTVADAAGNTSQQETDHTREDHRETSEVSLRQIEHAPDVNVTGSFKGKLHKGTSSQKTAKTTAEISKQETDHTQEGLREASEVSLGQIEEMSHHKSICNAEKEAKQESSNRVKSDDGDRSSKGTLAVEDESMQGRESTSEGRTGQEGSFRIPKNVSKISSSSAMASEKISDQTAMARMSGCQELDEVESFPCNESSQGNTQVLKLLIKYLKKQGKKDEADLSKHLASCSLNFQLMWNFYTQTDCGRKMLDVIIAKYYCKVSLPSDDHLKEFFIFEVSNAQFQEESDVKQFVDHVLHNIYICAQESLAIDLTGIDPRIQDDVREKLKERKELDCARTELVGEDNPVSVYTVCPRDHQQLVMQIITEVITDATKSFNSHKEMVTADFMWQRVMTRFEYLKEIGLKFPSTEIIQNKNQNAFLLKGPRDEVKAVAEHLEELLKMAYNEVHEEVFSPRYQFEIFACSEMCDYIDNTLPKLQVVWIPNHLTKEIHLFSRNPEELKGVDKFIKGCIEERLYPLSKDHSKLPLEKIHSLEELKKEHKGKIVIHVSESHTGLLVTTADDIFEGVDATMQKIISSEIGKVHPEICVPEKPAGRDGQPGCKTEFTATNPDKDLSTEKVSDSAKNITRSLEVKGNNLFKKLLTEHMENFKQKAKEHCVTIQVTERKSKVGFVLRGSEKKVQLIYDIIRTEEQQMLLQQDISGMVGAAEKVHKQMTPNPTAAGKSEDSEMYDCATEEEATPTPPPRVKKVKFPEAENTGLHEEDDDDSATEEEATPTPPPRVKKVKFPEAENTGLHEKDDDAKAEEHGVEQRDWPYPNGKKITLLKATSCDADVIIIPEKSDKDSQSHFSDKEIMELKVPVWTEGKAKTDLRKEIEQVLDKISKKRVGICIKTVEGWTFRHYLKCFLYQVNECFRGKEGKLCRIECLILLIDDDLDYTKALKIIQKCLKSEQGKPEVVANEMVLKEQKSIFKRIQVKVQKGQLHEAQTEVLVNTVARSLDLTKGVISSSLLKRAGDGIQKELYELKKKKFSFGQVLKTGVGTLQKPCRTIFHGVLFGFEDHPDSFKVFNDFLLSCLEHANKKYKSIAFPPIGTGGLGYPKDLVASLMFQSVAKFEQAHPTSKLEEVVFVIYEKDQETLKEFEEMHKRCLGASFEKVMEKHATEPQGTSPSLSKKVLPKAVTEMNKDSSAAVGGTALSSQKKTVVKEPASLDITEADRSVGKDIAPPKALLPGKEQHKNMLQYSHEEQCCFFVRDVRQQDVKSLEEQIKSSGLTAKFVYPYELGKALVICTNREEKDTLMNKLKKYSFQSVGPQKIQGLTAAVDPQIWRKASKMNKEQDLMDTVEQQSGVTISHTESSIQFKAVTSHQLEIAQECLIKFAKKTLKIEVQKRSAENSISGDVEKTEQIENVSQADFLALQSLEIYSEWTQKFNIKFTHEKETLYVQRALSYLSEEMKKEIEKEIAALRGKQKVEITYDPQELERFRSAIDEAKSEKLLLVWDDYNKQVLVYSDSFDEIQKFKHKVEFKMGKKKPTGRRENRFANQENTMPLLSEEEPHIEKMITRSFSWSEDATNVELFKTLEGIVIKVYEANILRLDVDCIVNAANDNLQHGGGVAWVIAQGAGPELDREGNDILKKRGRIKIGEQCVTTAGNLPYECIIHTVGPRWSDYSPHDAKNIARCERDLFNSIIGCFFEAENRHLKSVALPAISSGIFAVPRHMCTEQYAMAVIHYSMTRIGQGLQEIHFIDKLPDIVKDMQLAFKRHLSGNGIARLIVKGGDQTTAINDHAGRDSGNNKHDNKPEEYIGETYPKDERQTEEKQNPAAPVWPEIEQKKFQKKKFYVYKPNKKIEVNIHTTDITKLTGVDAIACSDDRRGKGLGAVAATLLKIGKSKYLNSKKKAFEKETHFGDVIVTDGGDSNFCLVAHAVIPSYRDNISLQRHKEIVRKCYDKLLDETSNWQKASLALPLLGAGCAELGHEGSAELFLDSLEVFCNRTKTLNIKIIHIVDNDERITEKIADVFTKHTDRVRRHSLASHGRELKPTGDPSSHTSSVGPQGEISQEGVMSLNW